jgi:hypothetical protein
MLTPLQGHTKAGELLRVVGDAQLGLQLVVRVPLLVHRQHFLDNAREAQQEG